MLRRLAVLVLLCGLLAVQPAHAIETVRIGVLAESRNFSGVILISRGDTIVYARSFGEVRPGCGKLHEPTARWRWASITRQAVATLPCRKRRCGVSIWMRRPAAIGPNLQPQTATRSPARHLLQHISGLPDPDDTALLTASLPEFYGTDFGGWRSKPVVWGLSALHRAPSITITIATSSSLADCLSAGRASR